MKKAIVLILALCLSMMLAGNNPDRGAAAETADPGFIPVALPQHEGYQIFGISPDGASYIAYREDCGSIGLIRDNAYIPFVRNESRAAADTHGCLDYWEDLRWLVSADDPVWSPDGRWIMITSYSQCFAYNNPVFPVLLDTQTMEYFLLYDGEFEAGSLTKVIWTTAAVFSPDSKQLYVMLYTNTYYENVPVLYCWDLETGQRTDLEIVYSGQMLDPFRDRLIERFGEEDWQSKGMEEMFSYFMLTRSVGALADGSLVFVADSPLFFDIGLAGLMNVRLTIDMPNRRAYCSWLQESVSDLDSYSYWIAQASGTDYVLSFQVYSTAAMTKEPDIYTTGKMLRDGCYFTIYATFEDGQDPNTDTPLFWIRQGDLPFFLDVYAEKNVILGEKFMMLDNVLSPDGQSMLVYGRIYGTYRKYLLHISFADMKITVLPVPDGTELPGVDNSYYSRMSHFIWSDSGVVLMKQYGNECVFRLEPAAEGVASDHSFSTDIIVFEPVL